MIATENCREKLYSTCIPSITKQRLLPDVVVLINDGKLFNEIEIDKIKKYFENIKIFFINNKHHKGVSGAWNSGIEYLDSINFFGFVAIIDDDDSWDSNHLQINYKFAKLNNADVVVSGLRMIKNGINLKRKLPVNLTVNDFLIGNPGWQGSNTFISLDILKKVRGFRSGLLSTNDRDLAIRVLNVSNIKIAYTNIWTANWFLELDNKSLSSPKSNSKILGLQWFWYIYQDFFNKEEEDAFFNRAYKYFEIDKKVILNIKVLPENRTLVGDLNV